MSVVDQGCYSYEDRAESYQEKNVDGCEDSDLKNKESHRTEGKDAKYQPGTASTKEQVWINPDWSFSSCDSEKSAIQNWLSQATAGKTGTSLQAGQLTPYSSNWIFRWGEFKSEEISTSDDSWSVYSETCYASTNHASFDSSLAFSISNDSHISDSARKMRLKEMQENRNAPHANMTDHSYENPVIRERIGMPRQFDDTNCRFYPLTRINLKHVSTCRHRRLKQTEKKSLMQILSVNEKKTIVEFGTLSAIDRFKVLKNAHDGDFDSETGYLEWLLRSDIIDVVKNAILSTPSKDAPRKVQNETQYDIHAHHRSIDVKRHLDSLIFNTEPLNVIPSAKLPAAKSYNMLNHYLAQDRLPQTSIKRGDGVFPVGDNPCCYAPNRSISTESEVVDHNPIVGYNDDKFERSQRPDVAVIKCNIKRNDELSHVEKKALEASKTTTTTTTTTGAATTTLELFDSLKIKQSSQKKQSRFVNYNGLKKGRKLLKSDNIVPSVTSSMNWDNNTTSSNESIYLLNVEDKPQQSGITIRKEEEVTVPNGIKDMNTITATSIVKDQHISLPIQHQHQHHHDVPLLQQSVNTTNNTNIICNEGDQFGNRVFPKHKPSKSMETIGKLLEKLLDPIFLDSIPRYLPPLRSETGSWPGVKFDTRRWFGRTTKPIGYLTPYGRFSVWNAIEWDKMESVGHLDGQDQRVQDEHPRTKEYQKTDDTSSNIKPWQRPWLGSYMFLATLKAFFPLNRKNASLLAKRKGNSDPRILEEYNKLPTVETVAEAHDRADMEFYVFAKNCGVHRILALGDYKGIDKEHNKKQAIELITEELYRHSLYIRCMKRSWRHIETDLLKNFDRDYSERANYALSREDYECIRHIENGDGVEDLEDTRYLPSSSSGFSVPVYVFFPLPPSILPTGELYLPTPYDGIAPEFLRNLKLKNHVETSNAIDLEDNVYHEAKRQSGRTTFLEDKLNRINRIGGKGRGRGRGGKHRGMHLR